MYVFCLRKRPCAKGHTLIFCRKYQKLYDINCEKAAYYDNAYMYMYTYICNNSSIY